MLPISNKALLSDNVSRGKVYLFSKLNRRTLWRFSRITISLKENGSSKIIDILILHDVPNYALKNKTKWKMKREIVNNEQTNEGMNEGTNGGREGRRMEERMTHRQTHRTHRWTTK